MSPGKCASLGLVFLAAAIAAIDAAPLRGAADNVAAVLTHIDKVLDKEVQILGNQVPAEARGLESRFEEDGDKFKELTEDELEEAIVGMLAVSLDMEKNRILYNDGSWVGGQIATYGGKAAGAKVGAATGAAIGAMFGGIGAAPGAAIGAIAGWFGGGAMVEYVDITRAEFFSGYSEYCTTREATGAAYKTAQALYAEKYGKSEPFMGCKTMDDKELCVQALLSQANSLSKQQNSDGVKALDTLDKATSVTDPAAVAAMLFGGSGGFQSCDSFEEVAAQ